MSCINSLISLCNIFFVLSVIPSFNKVCVYSLLINLLKNVPLIMTNCSFYAMYIKGTNKLQTLISYVLTRARVTASQYLTQDVYLVKLLTLRHGYS